MSRQFVIWGCGFRGKYLFEILGRERVVAFIDSNEALQNTEYKGIKIVDFKTYIEKFRKYTIILSMLLPDETAAFLNERGIWAYFLLTDCPEEFQGWGNYKELSKLRESFHKQESVAIYGINLFAILVHDYLKEQGVNDVLLIPQENFKKERLTAFSQQYPDIKIGREARNVNRVFNTVGAEGTGYLRQGLGVTQVIENCYDFSDRIPAYYHKGIERFKGIHSGERCFIVATGPSLKIADLDKLKENHEICFSMNRIYCAFDQTNWRPDYFVAVDRLFLQEYGREIAALDIKEKFIADCPLYITLERQEELGCYHNINYLHLSAADALQKRPQFSLDCAKKIHSGATVAYSCLQLAAYMGFKEIYLLGTDCSYSGKKPEKTDYFDKNYREDGRATNPVQLPTMFAAYEKARECAEQNGFQIYNATRGGKLEVFERVDFDSLF